MSLGPVEQLWRYPVKSMAGVSEAALSLDVGGPVGDRAWAVQDSASGVVVSAKREGRLLEARVEGDQLVLPTGVRAPLGSPGANRALSDWLARPVRLVHVGDEPTLRQEMHQDNEDERSPLMRWRTPRGRYVDLFPLHVVATGTLDRLAARYPELDWDVRRFRPNLVIRTDRPERELLGRHLRMGAVELSVPDQLTERCVMVTRTQPGLDAQRSMLRRIAESHGRGDAPLSVGSGAALLGCYARVVRPGTLRVGEQVEVIDPPGGITA